LDDWELNDPSTATEAFSEAGTVKSSFTLLTQEPCGVSSKEYMDLKPTANNDSETGTKDGTVKSRSTLLTQEPCGVSSTEFVDLKPTANNDRETSTEDGTVRSSFTQDPWGVSSKAYGESDRFQWYRFAINMAIKNKGCTCGLCYSTVDTLELSFGVFSDELEPTGAGNRKNCLIESSTKPPVELVRHRTVQIYVQLKQATTLNKNKSVVLLCSV
jgi:hypothetical protein